MSKLELFKACCIPHIDHECPAEGQSCRTSVLLSARFVDALVRLRDLTVENVSLTAEEQNWYDEYVNLVDDMLEDGQSEEESDLEESESEPEAHSSSRTLPLQSKYQVKWTVPLK